MVFIQGQGCCRNLFVSLTFLVYFFQGHVLSHIWINSFAEGECVIQLYIFVKKSYQNV